MQNDSHYATLTFPVNCKLMLMLQLYRKDHNLKGILVENNFTLNNTLNATLDSIGVKGIRH